MLGVSRRVYSLRDSIPTSWNSRRSGPRRGVSERGGCSAPEEFLLGFRGVFGTPLLWLWHSTAHPYPGKARDLPSFPSSPADPEPGDFLQSWRKVTHSLSEREPRNVFRVTGPLLIRPCRRDGNSASSVLPGGGFPHPSISWPFPAASRGGFPDPSPAAVGGDVFHTALHGFREF